jgi:phosphoenolpyruvate carboxykinase (GTP)
MTDAPPAHLVDWLGGDWTPGCGRPSAHPNSRFTSPAVNCPCVDPAINDPQGVPVSAIVFGGRRETDIPLVFQSYNWSHGVYLGATVGSEQTAAAEGKLGAVRRDPMAMLPFCGYHMGDYFRHWMHIHKNLSETPRIFHVNWFRKGADGKFLWSGFGDNARVLRWIVERASGRAYARETPLGWSPRFEDLDWRGLDYPEAKWNEVMALDRQKLKMGLVLQHEELFLSLSDRLPKELIFERELLVSRL